MRKPPCPADLLIGECRLIIAVTDDAVIKNMYARSADDTASDTA
jgi:hypothetical protein